MAAQKGFGINGRSPQYLVRVARIAFGRVELTPDRGMDAISADQDIRLILQFRSGCAVAEPGADLIIALLESRQLEPAADILATDALAHGIE
jgi:hypothetical protein